MTSQSASRTREEAAVWVARMDVGSWNDADEAELQQWLLEDPRRQGALLHAQAAWMTLDKPFIAEDDTTGKKVGKAIFGRRALFIGASAAIAASLVGGFLWAGSALHYSTAIGEIRRVPLADGSIAAINTASKVKVHFTKARREVQLQLGEAWFQVAKDAHRPFLVEAGHVFVQAVGTAFSVRRRDDGADILVTEGVVEAWADGAEGHRIRIVAGQRAFVADNAAISKASSPPSSVDRALAWRAGKIDLVGDTLSEAAEEFNRYNQRHIVLVDPMLASEQLDGVFRTDDPEGFAITVRSALDVPVDLSDPHEIRIGQVHQ